MCSCCRESSAPLFFVLVFQLARHNQELQTMLKPGGQVDGDEALEFYAKHTAQIEVNVEHAPAPGLR